tara:strand:- start:401 stop:784 length:384 start_codon:yes stop_codon:yes gene_type:complete
MKKNKDPNFVVKVEQAIEKKYGKETVQHPKANWDESKEKDYLSQIEELSEKQRKKKEKSGKVEKDGFLISKKLLSKESNRTCEACNVYSFNLKDDVYMTKFGACHSCYIKYIEDREERWNSGWRPDN